MLILTSRAIIRAAMATAATPRRHNLLSPDETELITREHRNHGVDVFERFHGDIRFAHAKVVDG